MRRMERLISTNFRSLLPWATLGLFAIAAVLTHLPSPRAVADDPTSIGQVLLYTDNSPGALLLANGHMTAARRLGYDVYVRTSTQEFVDMLPTYHWNYVIVAAQYATDTPPYADSLRTYVDGGGHAHIVRWRDDPSSPAPRDSAVLAPTAIQVWLNGATTTGYAECPDEKSATSSSGYSFSGFDGIRLGAISVLSNGTVCAISAGVYAAQPGPNPPPPTSQSCLATFFGDIQAAVTKYDEDKQACLLAYAPDPNASPPKPGNPEKLADCLKGASTDFINAITAAYRRYKVCLDIATQ